jgi:hypothetical protein
MGEANARSREQKTERNRNINKMGERIYKEPEKERINFRQGFNFAAA